MDEDHLMVAARTVALNRRPRDWSGAPGTGPIPGLSAHLIRPRRRARARGKPLIDRAPRFADLLDMGRGRPAFAALRRSESVGRPLGDEAFLDAISRRLNRVVTPRKRGRKPKGDVAGPEGDVAGPEAKG
ncbi:MAG TPA: hypothetical protein VKA12_03565 [Roseiarcus sp.]|nr:hypothetical protein [Roseiarcus sp.]